MGGDTNGISRKPCGFFDGWGEKFPTYVNKNLSGHIINRETDNPGFYWAENSFDGFFANPSNNLSIYTCGNSGYYFIFDQKSQRYRLQALPGDMLIEKVSFFGYPILHFHEQLQWLEYAIAHYLTQQKMAVFEVFKKNLYPRYFKMILRKSHRQTHE